MDDPYKILGVSKDASEETIRKAYRKLAKELHPDLNPGDKAAEARFKEVSAAYHILGDPERRGKFDRGEIDASGTERPQQQYYREYANADPQGRYSSSAGFGDFEDFSDLFAEMFGGNRARGAEAFQKQDVRYHLDIDFLDAVNGAKRRITLPGGNVLDLTIPAGTRDGSVLRLKGKGMSAVKDGPAGDALIEISVRPHALFRRDGQDIVMELPVTIDEAALGGKVEVPTVTGRVAMSVPKGANSGDVLRLKGKGVPSKKGAPGDQLVTLRIVMPDRIDDGLVDFLKTWREKHKYNPRARMEQTP